MPYSPEPCSALVEVPSDNSTTDGRLTAGIPKLDANSAVWTSRLDILMLFILQALIIAVLALNRL